MRDSGATHQRRPSDDALPQEMLIIRPVRIPHHAGKPREYPEMTSSAEDPRPLPFANNIAPEQVDPLFHLNKKQQGPRGDYALHEHKGWSSPSEGKPALASENLETWGATYRSSARRRLIRRSAATVKVFRSRSRAYKRGRPVRRSGGSVRGYSRGNGIEPRDC